MLNPKALKPGEEQYEQYKCGVTKKCRYQYDYRANNGRLFTCVKSTLETCRLERDKWLANQ